MNTENNAATASQRTHRPLISIVLPVFNERHVLETLHTSILRAIRSYDMDYEMVFIDDGSSDGSSDVLDRLASIDPHVRVVHFARNFGHQAAVQAGLEHARGDAVVLMDSDMQDAPEAIPRFVDQWRDGYDVVYAIRADRKESRLKRMAFAAFYQLLSRIASTPIPQDAGNFGLVDRRVARHIADLKERDRYFPGLRSWVGFRQIGIVVERAARYDGQPRVSFWGLCRLAKTAIFSFSSFPLSVFGVIGMLALGIFAALSSFSLFCRLFTDLAIPGWTSHILSASFFGALNALGISILGEYVIRIYDQVRERPIFVVDSTRNVDEAVSRGTAAGQVDLHAEIDALNENSTRYDRKSQSNVKTAAKHNQLQLNHAAGEQWLATFHATGWHAIDRSMLVARWLHRNTSTGR